MTLLPIFAALFTKGIAKERFGIFMRIVTAIQLLIVIALPFGGIQFSVDLLLLSEACMLISLLYGMATAFLWIKKAVRSESGDGKITFKGFTSVLLRTVMGNTFIGLLFVIVSSVFAVIRSTFLETDQNSVIIGLFAFVLSVSFSLQNEVTETKHQIIHQNEELEGMVQSRTRDLEEQTELAVTASKTKSRFLATMSHEIRTPMNAIIGISEILLQRGDLNNEIKEGVTKIHHSGQNLLGIINDILDLSKAETGKLEIVPAEFSLPELINDTVLLNIVRIGSKPIEFSMSLSENIPERLIGDELRIKQILNNILSNAFKYTEKGSVNFALEGEMTENHFNLKFTVSDTGQGMREEELKTLFDEYSRFNKIANRKTEGTGLGMNITGQLISLMGGKIDVSSEFGKGSVFTVLLPLVVMPETPFISPLVCEQLCDFTYGDSDKNNDLNNEKREYMPYGKVLVVDDVETNLYVAEGLLKPYGINVSTVSSGYAAIDIINSGETFDIIFMDHMMPKMDGIEATKIIRSKNYTAPIVALTANAIVGNDEMFKSNGFDDFISKPIDVRDLNRVLYKFVRSRRPDEEKPPAPPPEKLVNDVNEKLISVFGKDVKKALTSLPEQFEQSDFVNLAITSHGMKSAAANVGETQISETAKAVEFAAKNNDFETVKEKLPELIAMLKAFEAKNTRVKKSGGKSIIPADLQKELLLKAREFCENFNERGVNEIIAKMREYELSEDMTEFLENIEDYLLHAEFETAEARIIERL
jgi:signal transduction histidine kinase/CheY-like chemotaxis protein